MRRTCPQYPQPYDDGVPLLRGPSTRPEDHNKHSLRWYIFWGKLQGAKIAVESYGPFVDPESFSVEGVVRIIDHDLGWYVENGFEYLVFSTGMYGRFYRDRDRYAAEASRYDAFFSQVALVREFGRDGETIRVCRVDR